MTTKTVTHKLILSELNEIFNVYSVYEYCHTLGAPRRFLIIKENDGIPDDIKIPADIAKEVLAAMRIVIEEDFKC